MNATKKINITLISLLIFLLYSNFLTWKENIKIPKNFDNSAIGSTVKNQMLQNISNDFFSISKDDIINRISVSKYAQAYIAVPLATDSLAMGHIDEATRQTSGWKITGWTYVPESAGIPKFVLAVENGKVVSALKVEKQRPDVAKALNSQRALLTGYSGQITSQSTAENCNLKLYTLSSSLKLFSMPNIC